MLAGMLGALHTRTHVCRQWAVVVLVTSLSMLGRAAAGSLTLQAERRPSLLFGTSGGLTGSDNQISEDFVQALYNGTYGTAFEVDCTGSVDELTRARIFQ